MQAIEQAGYKPGEEISICLDVASSTFYSEETKLYTLGADGTLRWDAPSGEWEILRFGYTLNDHCRVSTCSDGWNGYALDPFDSGVFRDYWNQVVEPLIADAKDGAVWALDLVPA